MCATRPSNVDCSRSSSPVSSARRTSSVTVLCASCSLSASSVTVDCPLPSGEPSTISSSRSEEHTSELQSLRHLVCRLLLEKKKHNINPAPLRTAAVQRLTALRRDRDVQLPANRRDQ